MKRLSGTVLMVLLVVCSTVDWRTVTLKNIIKPIMVITLGGAAASQAMVTMEIPDVMIDETGFVFAVLEDLPITTVNPITDRDKLTILRLGAATFCNKCCLSKKFQVRQ